MGTTIALVFGSWLQDFAADRRGPAGRSASVASFRKTRRLLSVLRGQCKRPTAKSPPPLSRSPSERRDASRASPDCNSWARKSWPQFQIASPRTQPPGAMIPVLEATASRTLSRFILCANAHKALAPERLVRQLVSNFQIDVFAGRLRSNVKRHQPCRRQSISREISAASRIVENTGGICRPPHPAEELILPPQLPMSPTFSRFVPQLMYGASLHHFGIARDRETARHR